jgi:enamine deaminase RidA (YjgF/YER057c/UK114 family)
MSEVVGARPRPQGSEVSLRLRRTAANGIFLVASVPPAGDPAALAADTYGRIADLLRDERLEIVQERVFASLSVQTQVMTARADAFQARGLAADGPLTCVQGRPVWGEGLAGVIVRAVPVAECEGGVRTILDGRTARGRAWRTDDATFTILQNLRGLRDDPACDNSPASQASRAIELADRLLRDIGAGYRDTVRTWFYLSDILAWYPDFNRARTARYREFGLMTAEGQGHPRLPASTGIRADLPPGTACVLDLLAVSGHGSVRPTITSLSNPHQQEAFRYGSAFARAAAVMGRRETLLEISGTAAIDEAGTSLHPGDVRAQARCTLDKVAALIAQTGATLDDICAATIFVKNGADLPAVHQVLADRGLERLPAVYVEADVCRDELLFEIDAEAVVPAPGNPPISR